MPITRTRRIAAGTLAITALVLAGRAEAAEDPLDTLLRAADMGGMTVGEVTIEGGVAVLDVQAWEVTIPPDDVLAMMAGVLDPGWGVDSVVVRVLDGGHWVPMDRLWAPPPDVLAILREQGRSNLAAWKSNPPPPAHWPHAGSLAGRRIILSPGHGWTWFDTSWQTQRGYVNGIIEDFSNAETMNEYLIPMLERMGATVVSCRERGRTTEEVVVDNDGADGAYVETGDGWRDGSEPGHLGTYRACEASPGSTSEAVFRFTMDRGDVYPVYVRWVASDNRGDAIPVRIDHAGGEAYRSLNQRADDDRWTWLGAWYFEEGVEHEIALSADGPAGSWVIADAVRIGGGMGDIAPGGEISGHPRWEEAAKYWIQYVGAPPTVYDQAAPDELYSDHYSRPSYAEWVGGDAYLMYHTNAFDGTARGTVSFIHESSPSPGSASLADEVHGAIIEDIRALYEADWYDRGVRTGSYIELGVVDSMPAMLVELAFHDNPDDAAHLTDPDFRFHVSRAMARGFASYFDPSRPAPPLPPERLRAVNLGGGRVRLSWQPPEDDALPDTPVDRYRIYTSTNGRGFDNGDLTTTETGIELDLDWPANHYFLVTSENDGGESMPTETLAVRTSWPGSGSPVLLVAGFDRLDRWVREYENTRDFAVEHGEAIAAAADGAYAFDFADNEAVARGDVDLGSYMAVVWYAGEESVTEESFSDEEMAVLQSYIAAGGSIFVSGSEIGWDLVERGDAGTRAWFEDVLHASYDGDDAEVWQVDTPTGIFAGLDPFSFDPEDGAAYDADYPDVLSPAGGSTVSLPYGSGAGGAGIEWDGGDARVVYWGFPFETVVGADTRADLMERILLFLVPETPVPPDPEPDADAPETTDASTDAEAEEPCTCRTQCACSMVW